MNALARAVARVLFGSLLAAGTAVGLAVAGLSDPAAAGAGVGVGLVVGRALFGKPLVPSLRTGG
ncbi:MAG: hypothetical protein V5A23_08875 [Halobacteriales archaeon]